jgi:hypothetical protein
MRKNEFRFTAKRCLDFREVATVEYSIARIILGGSTVRMDSNMRLLLEGLNGKRTKCNSSWTMAVCLKNEFVNVAPTWGFWKNGQLRRKSMDMPKESLSKGRKCVRTGTISVLQGSSFRVDAGYLLLHRRLIRQKLSMDCAKWYLLLVSVGVVCIVPKCHVNCIKGTWRGIPFFYQSWGLKLWK